MAEHAVLDGQSGGAMGDPFESMAIKNNVLILKFSGGSREQRTTTHRYRFKDKLYFSVIGAAYKVDDCIRSTVAYWIADFNRNRLSL